MSDTKSSTTTTECKFSHNQSQLVMQEPIKLVRNDPKPCPECGKMLYITIERSPANNLLTSDILWRVYITDKPIREKLRTQMEESHPSYSNNDNIRSPKVVNGKTYLLKSGQFKGSKYWVEGLWNKMPGNHDWTDDIGRIGCMEFAVRSAKEGGYDPTQHDKIYYGKIGLFGKLIHESQIGEEVEPDNE